MFRFWRVSEAVALQEKQMATQNEFAQADYMDRMNGFGGQPGGMWGMGRGPGIMGNGPLLPGRLYLIEVCFCNITFYSARYHFIHSSHIDLALHFINSYGVNDDLARADDEWLKLSVYR